MDESLNFSNQEPYNRSDIIEKIKFHLNMDEHMMPLDLLVNSLHTNLKAGMSNRVAEKLLKKNGKNKLHFSKYQSRRTQILRNFFGGFAFFLWIGAAVCLLANLIYYITEKKYHVDYLVLGILLIAFNLLNSYFSFYQNEKNSEILRSFKRVMLQTTIITRDGERLRIPSERLVVGDLIELNEGNIVPADIRIVKSFNLKIDSFSITGLIKPQIKSTINTNNDPLLTKNLAFLGNHVLEGTGQGLVIRTGDQTLYGRIAHLNLDNHEQYSYLGKELNRFIRIITVIGVTLGALFFIISFLIGGHDWLSSAKLAIGLIIAQVPECLMTTVALALRLATKKLQKKNCLIKNIETIEKLGSISAICSDKTGTLTQNSMSVRYMWYNNSLKNMDSNELYSDVSLRRVLDSHPLLFDALLCNSVTFLKNKKILTIKKDCIGDPTDIAILRCIEKIFGSLIDYQSIYPKVFEIPFNSKNKFQLSVHESVKHNQFKGFRILMKGAPEIIIEKCTTIYIDGNNLEMNSFWLEKCQKYLKELAQLGHKVIGYCDYYLDVKDHPRDFEFGIDMFEKPNFPIDKMRFLGLISMHDPPRPNVNDAVQKCKKAGIRIIMITGDHPITAKVTARMLGIITENNIVEIDDLEDYKNSYNLKNCKAAVINGSYLKNINEKELDNLLIRFPEIVFARISPNQKCSIVESCQRLGETVAVTGDAVNDSAALKKADVGIAMGIAGTDVTKEAADMILLDDNFATIEIAIEEGQLIYDNLKKSIAYTLSTKIAEITPFLIYILVDIPLPLGTIVILLIDLVTEIFPPVSLAYEKNEFSLIDRLKIDTKHDGLVNQRLISMAYGQIGIIQASAGYFMYTVIMAENGFFPSKLLGIRKSWDSVHVNDLKDSYGQEWTYEQRKILEYTCYSGFFISILIVQWADLIRCKTRKDSILKQGMKNHVLNLALILETIVAIFLCYTPTVSEALHMYPLKLKWLLIPLPFAFLIIFYDELRKYLIRKYNDGWIKRETYY